MKQAEVLYTALKHGLSEDEILHAWKNAFDAKRIERDFGNIDIVAIGVDDNGRLVEMTAREKADHWLIYHANTPISNRTKREFGL